ncbi:MAG: hypothetical protein NT031_20900, partial [Planctomycetota bacterium]|nr:hypothetical protein [Planctomycetota bacterium]
MDRQQPRFSEPAGCVEPLEPRVFLSAVTKASPKASPTFKVFRTANGVAPAATASPTGLTPANLISAYGIDHISFGGIVGDGTGQTIAIVDAYDAPTIVADLAVFDQTFNLPAPPSLTIVGQTGTSTLPGTDPAGKGKSWAVETSLDVQWAHAMAPNASILLVEANSDLFSDLLAAVDTARSYAGVCVVSMSWAAPESAYQPSYDLHFATPS